MVAPSRGRGRQDALKELAKLTRQAGKPLPSHALPIQLYDDLLHHFGSIMEARRAAGLAQAPYPRRWTAERVVAEIRRLHRRGIVIRHEDLIDAGREDLAGAIRVYLGSIVRARILARVPHPERRLFEPEAWDEDRVVSEIVDLHEKRKPVAYSRAPKRLVNAGVRLFGSWQTAIEAAGLDYAKVRLRRPGFDDERALEALRELADERPHLTLGELHNLPLGLALLRRFDSIEKAARLAGLVEWPLRTVHRVLSRKETLAGLRRRQRQGRGVYKTAVQRDDMRLWNSARRHFGTLRAALDAAGLENDSPIKMRWTREEVLETLADRQRRGASLSSSVIQDELAGLYKAAVTHFGSFPGALAEIGAKLMLRAPWTKSELVRELKRRARGNKVLFAMDVPPNIVSACQRRFGSFAAARQAAGLPGPRPRRSRRRGSRSRSR
jgi:hypothetical protein